MSLVRMATVLLVICLTFAAIATASEKTRCACARIYNPVCGTDRVTYANPCELKCAARTGKGRPDLGVAKMGPCEE